MGTTPRLGLTTPQGTLAATSTAVGTTTTLVGASAGVNLQVGDKFRLYNAGTTTIRENTLFTVTDRTGGATITITFTPAAALAVGAGVAAYIPKVVDASADIALAYQSLDEANRVRNCTAISRPIANLYTGALAFETDTQNLIKYSGSAWEVIQNAKWPRGWCGYASSNALGPAVAANGESAIPGLTVTFDAVVNQIYAVVACIGIRATAGNDAPAFLRARYAAGATVDTSGTEIATIGADFNDNSTGAVLRTEYAASFTATGSGQVTVGLFLGRPNNADGKAVQAAEYQAIYVESLGRV